MHMQNQAAVMHHLHGINTLQRDIDSTASSGIQPPTDSHDLLQAPSIRCNGIVWHAGLGWRCTCMTHQWPECFLVETEAFRGCGMGGTSSLNGTQGSSFILSLQVHTHPLQHDVSCSDWHNGTRSYPMLSPSGCSSQYLSQGWVSRAEG